MNYDDLVGVGEIADINGVSQQVVSNWIIRWEDWPAPVRRLKMGPIWSYRQVNKCLRTHGR